LEFRWESYQTDQYLKNWISESVVLSEANETDVLPENALILDILISGYQCGSSAVLWFDNILPIPIWWRPKIRLCGRLAKSNNCELIGIYHTIKAMGW